MRLSCDSFCAQLARDNFRLHYSNWWLLFALLHLTTFSCNTASVNFCMNYWIAYVFMKYCKKNLLDEQLHLRTFVCINVLQSILFLCTITIDIFCMHYWIWYPFAPLKSTVFMHYCNWHLLYVLLHLNPLVCFSANKDLDLLVTFSFDNFWMHLL